MEGRSDLLVPRRRRAVVADVAVVSAVATCPAHEKARLGSISRVDPDRADLQE